MSTSIAHPRTTIESSGCTSAERVTESLLGYGMVAGPLYVLVSLAQAALHDGFDLTRHDWSLLAAGPAGWIQSANLIITGAMIAAFSVGLARSTTSRWAPRLIAIYGVGLTLAGALIADPMAGYPVGVDAPTTPSWHALGHVVAGGLGFLAVIAGAFVLARTFAREGAHGYAWWSRATGTLYLAGFIGIASGGTGPAVVLVFTAAVFALWVWIAGVALRQYREVGDES